MTGKCALRALKRKISDTLYEQMLHDTRPSQDPGGHSGNDAASSAAGSHPDTPALRTSHSRATTNSRTATGDQTMLTSQPAPDKRRTSRSAAGGQVEARPRPAPRARAVNDLDASEHRPQSPAQEQANLTRHLTQRGPRSARAPSS